MAIGSTVSADGLNGPYQYSVLQPMPTDLYRPDRVGAANVREASHAKQLAAAAALADAAPGAALAAAEAAAEQAEPNLLVAALALLRPCVPCMFLFQGNLSLDSGSMLHGGKVGTFEQKLRTIRCWQRRRLLLLPGQQGRCLCTHKRRMS